MERRWRQYAALARYGHQDVSALLGRALRPLEVELLHIAIQDLLDHEYQPVTPSAGDP